MLIPSMVFVVKLEAQTIIVLNGDGGPMENGWTKIQMGVKNYAKSVRTVIT
jgi:hypothetical protein